MSKSLCLEIKMIYLYFFEFSNNVDFFKYLNYHFKKDLINVP